MNILFFTENSPYAPNRVGGAENSMRLMAEGLARRGHHVTFASLRPDVLPWPKRFRANGVEVLLCPGPRRSPLQRALGRIGRASSGPARALRAASWRRVGRTLFGAARFDLVYAFYEIAFLAQALAARDGGRQPGLRVVLRMAGLGWREAAQRGGGASLAEIAALFNAVDAVNYLSDSSQALVEKTAADLGMALVPRSSFVADIGVDVAATPKVWGGPRPGPGLEIVVATRFSAYQKRQDILVAALGLLRGRLAVRATMIGAGVTRDAIIAQRDALGLTDAIEIVPFMAQDRLWETMGRADLLCHPCDHEGVSKIILEAMMLGLPVLASDVAPLPDYVIEGETGYRVANTPEAWAERLIAIAGDKAALPALSDRARRFVETRYAVDRNLGLYEARFRDMIAEPP